VGCSPPRAELARTASGGPQKSKDLRSTGHLIALTSWDEWEFLGSRFGEGTRAGGFGCGGRFAAAEERRKKKRKEGKKKE